MTGLLPILKSSPFRSAFVATALDFSMIQLKARVENYATRSESSVTDVLSVTSRKVLSVANAGVRADEMSKSSN